MNRLDNKTALVTGAGRGIGRAIALELAKRGAAVVINYNGSREKAMETADMITGAGGRAMLAPCSVTDSRGVEQMIQKVLEAYGHLDILVNNAGITRDDLLLRMKEEDFDAVVDTNLKGTFLTMKYAVKPMVKQRGGRIINISSVSGILGNAGQANYAASKAGVIGLTKTMARELAGRGITVNALAPGFVETEMTASLSERVKENAVAMIPLGRFGKPEEIAYMAAFLASEEAAYITGQVLSVDGGMAI